jgi:mannitol-1-phosphate/altronate dehydrogenase
MDFPAARDLVETIRQINEMGRRARAGEPSVEDYLQTISSDPVTEWFTELLREKNEELEKERRRADRLANALRAWYQVKETRMPNESSEAELQLVHAIRATGIADI